MSTEAAQSQPLSREQALPSRSTKRAADDGWIPDKTRAVAGPDQEMLDAVWLSPYTFGNADRHHL